MASTSSVNDSEQSEVCSLYASNTRVWSHGMRPKSGWPSWIELRLVSCEVAVWCIDPNASLAERSSG